MQLNYDPSDPPSPLAVIRAALGVALVVATVILGVLYLDTGHLDSHFVALVGALWLFWGVFHDLLALLVQPLAAILGAELTGGQDPGPSLRIDIERETEMLELLVANPPPVPHREILEVTGIIHAGARSLKEKGRLVGMAEVME